MKVTNYYSPHSSCPFTSTEDGEEVPIGLVCDRKTALIQANERLLDANYP